VGRSEEARASGIQRADERADRRSGEPACTATDVAEWQILVPKPTSRKPTDAANATALRDAVAALDIVGTVDVGGVRENELAFSAPIAEEDYCTEIVELRVPLRGRDLDRAGRKVVRVAATTSVPEGERRGLRDVDKLKLVCTP